MRWLALALLLTACGGESEPDPEPTPDPPPEECQPGHATLDDGTCLEPGMQSNGCAAGESFVDGSCTPAGIPPGGCGGGFTYDEVEGCIAVLPPTRCEAGQMAVPGDSLCREVAPCGTGTWGDIPLEAGAQFVDASYPGGDSDGTQAKPWLTVSEAVTAAQPDALIAVAAGSYAEDVRLESKAVRLWGRCPQMVEIVGTGADFGAIDIRIGADGSEVHQLALTGANQAIALAGSEDVVVDRVWMHDTGGPAMVAQHNQGPTSALVIDSLVDNARDVGIIVIGATLTLDRTLVRDTVEGSGPAFGQGVSVQGTATPGNQGVLEVTSSVLEGNRFAGVSAIGGIATIEDSVLRDQVSATAQFAGIGAGIYGIVNWATGEPASLTVRGCRLQNNTRMGIGAQATLLEVDRTVIVDTQPFQPDNRSGKGIDLEYDVTTDRSAEALISHSLLARNQEVSLHVVGSVAEVVGTLVKDTLPQAASQNFGRGISLDGAGSTTSSLTVRSSVIDGNRGLGIHVNRSALAMEGTLVRNTLPHAHSQLGGRGVNIQADVDPGTNLVTPSVATIHASRVSNGEEVGIFALDSSVTITSTRIDTTLVQQDNGLFGDGVAVISTSFATAVGEIAHSTINGNERAGLLAFDATVGLLNVSLDCNPIQLNVEGAGAIRNDGDNRCGCGAEETACQTQSSGLEAPAAVE